MFPLNARPDHRRFDRVYENTGAPMARATPSAMVLLPVPGSPIMTTSMGFIFPRLCALQSGASRASPNEHTPSEHYPNQCISWPPEMLIAWPVM